VSECVLTLGPAKSTRYFEAATLNEELGALSEALKCAEKGLRLERDCLGLDHALYEHSVVVVQKLKARQ
jgi:hypothetical protein